MRHRDSGQVIEAELTRERHRNLEIDDIPRPLARSRR